MTRLSSFLSRLAIVLTLTVSALSPLAAMPTSAANVMFSCWCQNTATRICNHHQIDSGIADSDPLWSSLGLAIASAGTLGVRQTLEALTADHPDLDARLASSDVRQACRDRCSADGGDFRAIHFETQYRGEICTECNPSADSSCSESASDRLTFGDAKVAEDIAQCEDRKAATSLLPVRLAVPIGGVSEVDGLPDYINVAYRYMVTIVLVVAIVMVVYGGFRYLVGASLGDIQAGKKIIQDAIVGMLLVLGAYTILSTINPATTILSFKAPDPIRCQDLALSEAVKNALCSTDAECTGGTRCVLAKNYVASISNVADATVGGAREGAALAEDFVGSGKAAGVIGFLSNPLSLFTESTEERRARGSMIAQAGGAVVGGTIGRDVGIIEEIRKTSEDFHVCSTGQQGSPCAPEASFGATEGSITGDRFCADNLECVESWGMCWPGSGNAPGMPCDEDSACSNGSCVEVTGTDYKVCEIQVRDSTPCFRAGEDHRGMVFPAQCSGVDGSGTAFTCAYCPSGEDGTPRNWTILAPGDSYEGQCKPLSVLSTPTACAR